MREWLRVAFTRPVVRRGIKYAVVVGAILILINHGDALAAGRVTPLRLMQMGLTLMVPYCVSVLSSVGATMDVRARVRPPGRESSP
jgi:hypothetical protein